MNGRARGVRVLVDVGMYLFLAPNGQGVPVFGHCPFKRIRSQKNKQVSRKNDEKLIFKLQSESKSSQNIAR